MYWSKIKKSVFVQITNVFVQILKCICPNSKMYLSKIQNVLIEIANFLSGTNVERLRLEWQHFLVWPWPQLSLLNYSTSLASQKTLCWVRCPLLLPACSSSPKIFEIYMKIFFSLCHLSKIEPCPSFLFSQNTSSTGVQSIPPKNIIQ